jgi:plastocyanin
MKSAAVFAAAAALAIAACGGSGSSSSSSPSGPSPTSPTTPPADAVATSTITISNGVATPKNVKVARGTQVTFINNDTQSHNMASDPHPEHTDCPEINSVGVLLAGQTRRTDNMTTNRTVCGFHDHDLPNVAGLQGSITIQ